MSDQSYLPPEQCSILEKSAPSASASTSASESAEDAQSLYGNDFVQSQISANHPDVGAGLGGWLDFGAPSEALTCEAPREEAPVCTDRTQEGSTSTEGPAPAAAKSPAPVGHDVEHMDPDRLAEMKADPKTAQLAQTIQNAQLAYADLIKGGAKVTVTTSDANGGKPVVVITPAGFDPNQPARVHTHYHGYNSTVADPVGHGAGVTARIGEVQARDPQTVFVLPECDNVPKGDDTSPDHNFGKNYATDWSNVKSVTKTTDDALASAGITGGVGKRVLSAHSGGGKALASAMKNDPTGEGMRCDQLELQDCLYGGTENTAVKDFAGTAAGRDCKRVLYYPTSGTLGNDQGFKKDFGDRYKGASTMPALKPGENPVVVPAAKGRIARKQWSNEHDRTVGGFMDARD